MRGDSGYPSSRRVRPEQLPDDLFAQADGARLAGAVHWSEYVPVSDPGCGSPRVGRHLHPCRHRDRPHTAVLSDEIHDAPPSVPLLNVGNGERSHLGPPQPAAQEDRQDRAVAQALGRGGVRRVQEFLRLLDG